MQLSKRGLLILSAVGLFWLTMIVRGLALVNSPWDGWRPATCAAAGCFCEAVRSSLIQQPANAASSMWFVAVAFLIAARPFSAWQPVNRPSTGVFASRKYPLGYAIALVVLGLGSAFFHASLTFVGQTVDVFGMYLLVTFLLVFNATRLFNIRAQQAIVAYVAINCLLLWALVSAPEARRIVFAGIVVAVLLLEIILWLRGQGGRAKLLLGAVASLTVGGLIWTLDNSGTLCAPNSLLQGHAVWHASGALAAGLMFAYLESCATHES